MNREEYLELFTPTLRGAIKGFCDDLQNSEADCFVILPRKAVCFVRSLLLVGLLAPEFSNRTMYFSTSFAFNNNTFANKKIAIVDDVAITGVSIAEATNMLIDTYGVKPQNIEIIILAANSDSFFLDFTDEKSKKSLLNPNRVRKLNKIDCSTLCNNIATVLCSMGIPYDCEFPNYNNTIISNQEYHDLFSPLFWEKFNVSNQYHQSSGINAITLLPLKSAIRELFREIGVDLSNWVHFKIRAFSKRIDPNTLEVRIVPMVTINEIPTSYISKLYKTFIDRDFERMSITAKFRLLQFYFAFCLGEFFWSKSSISNKPNLDSKQLFGLFGNTQEKLFSILGTQKIYHDFYLEDTNIANTHNINIESDSIKRNHLSFEPNNLFSKSIIQLYKNRQNFALKYLSSHNNFRELSSSGLTNLKSKDLSPFSYRHFCETITNNSKYYNVNSLVSIFLDRATDLGFLVPTVHINNKTISKAYRHGEGSEGINSDLQCFKLFISEFRNSVFEKLGSFSQISSIDLQKIIVLFCHFANQKGLLNNFMKFDNGCFITSQYSIHGAIPAVYKFPELINENFKFHSYAEDDEYSVWITDLLVREKCISRANFELDSGPYIIHNFSTDDISIKGKKHQVRQIAILIGEWYSIYNDKFDANVFRNEATILTSCENVSSITKALLAEVQYCIRNWYGDFNEQKTKSQNDFINYLNDILKSNSYLAINSGLKKFEDFIYFDKNSMQDFTGQNIMLKTISEIHENLKSTNRLAGEMWNELWENYCNYEPITNEDSKKNIIKLVNFLYCFSAVYRALWIVSSKNDGTSLIDELICQYETNMSKWKNTSVLNCFNKCRELIVSQATFEKKLNDLSTMFFLCVQKAEQCRDDIEDDLDLGFNNYSEKYDGCLIISFNATKDFSISNIIHETVKFHRKKYNELLAVEVSNSFRSGSQNQDEQYFFILAKAENNLVLLFQVMKCILENDKIKNIKHSCILCPALPEEAKYLYSLDSNLQKSNDRFRQKIVNPLRKKLENFKWDFVLVSSPTTYDNHMNYIIDQSDYFINTFGNIEPMDTDEIKLMLQEIYTMQIYNTPSIRIGIITIRDDETLAVINEFNLVQNNSKKAIYYTGEYKTKQTTYQLYLRRATGKGNTLAASALSMLMKDWNIGYAVLLGVAGTIKPDEADICDVVIANKIIDMTYGAETSDGCTPKTTMPEININLIDKINNFQTQIYGQEFPNSDNLPEGKNTFRCVVGSIGDNGYVVKSDEAKSRNNLKIIDSSCIAVETESAGVASLLGDWKLENPDIIGPLVIRGISDRADIKKDKKDKFHFTASKNAAIILKKILSYL